MIPTRVVRKFHRIRILLLILSIGLIYLLLSKHDGTKRQEIEQKEKDTATHNEDAKIEVNQLNVEDRIRSQESMMDQVIKEAENNLEEIAKQETVPQPPPEKPEYKCRHRSSKYSDAFLVDVTSRLSKALQRYVRLHDKQLKNFTAIESANAPLTWANNTSRFVLWLPEPSSSVYQQLTAFLSSFMVALLSDRAIIIPKSVTIEEGFCAPLKSPIYIEDHIIEQLLKEASVFDVKRRIPQKAKLLMDYQRDLMCGGNFKERYEHVQWLILRTSTSLLPWIRQNKAYEQAWNVEYFPEGLAFRPLFNALMHPSNELWDIFKAIQKEYHAYEHKIGYYADTDEQLEAIKGITSGKKRSFLYSFSDEFILEGSLSAKHLINVEIPKSNWQFIALDLQMIRYLDSLYLPADKINSSDPHSLLLLHSIRNKETFLYKPDGSILPLAPCDHYNLKMLTTC